MSDANERLALVTQESARTSRTTLMRRAQRGELLRLRPGVYVGARDWRSAKPWVRHLGFAAAVSLHHRQAVLCGETALAVYGVPLLAVPTAVDIRASSKSAVGCRGPCVPGGLPIKRHGLGKPHGVEYDQAWGVYRDPQTGVGTLQLPVPYVVDVAGDPVLASVEPLPFVLMNTVPRLSRQAAVVALDAVQAGRYAYGQLIAPQEFMAFERWLRTEKSRTAWKWADQFADQRSESPGESRSRVIIQELGFEAPELQHRVQLPNGDWLRCDFSWDRGRIVGEFDGRIKYDDARRLSGTDDRSVYWAQVRREEAIRDTGRRVVRWGWEDLDTPSVIERKLLREGVPRRRRGD